MLLYTYVVIVRYVSYVSYQTPIDLIKIKLQTQIFENEMNPRYKAEYTTVAGCIRHVVKTEGMMSLFQGLRATIFRNVPGNALFFPGKNQPVGQQLLCYATIRCLPCSSLLVSLSVSTTPLSSLIMYTISSHYTHISFFLVDRSYLIIYSHGCDQFDR